MMSDLQRSFAKAQLAKLPPEPIAGFDERDEDDDAIGLSSASSADSSSSASSTGTIKPSPSQNLFERPNQTTARNRYAPLPWTDFFATECYHEQITTDCTIRHHTYLTPPLGSGPLIVTHHGAGSSGLSFAAFTKEVQKLIKDAGVLSLDARHHGDTTVTDTAGSPVTTIDLSLNTLAKDLAFVVEGTKSQMGWTQLPDIVLVGHSLGGAVVTEVANRRALGNALIGYGVLDVVEGSAMDALQSMEAYLSTRPKSFPSLASGIEWHIRSRTIRSSTSARVSVPSLLRQTQSLEVNPEQWSWRTDLRATKPFWEDWFIGLSEKFLESRGGKLLILAGTDRLDKKLMIGQMQGKYQLQVFPEAGHFVHEDQPEKTAVIVADFYRRNDRSALILPPKVDDLIKQGKLRPSSGAGR